MNIAYIKYLIDRISEQEKERDNIDKRIKNLKEMLIEEAQNNG